ncbi:MAG: glycerol-3-phosphate 1-O-acyltransferase [Candidatus Westeberhardia cardiocondylae]|nr:glycerol-3-phosphate 1-O-acyltransferase [Candidatus Westeberhardia cardiocondylae]
MFILFKIYYFLLYVIIKIFVRVKVILKDFNSSIYSPVIYVLPECSNIDLLILRMQCLKNCLPDPLLRIYVDSVTFASYIFLYDRDFRYENIFHSLKLNKFFRKYFKLYNTNNSILDIKLVLVLVVFGRSTNNENKRVDRFYFWNVFFNKIKRFISILWYGRDCFLYFFRFFSSHYICVKYFNDKKIIQKITRVIRIYFFRQYIVVNGPDIFNYKKLLNKLLFSENIRKILIDIVNIKNISMNEAKKKVISFIKEIYSNFSYGFIRLFDKILFIFFNYYYRSLYVNNIFEVYNLINNGHRIIYIPCHRSHVDYLLISYVIYNYGLVPPHIIAGNNLNFWPIGIIFRNLGAFFIRRTFKNKFYSVVFSEYFFELFVNGFTIEYFIEGGRSRTGKLLSPKTGILSILVKMILKNFCKSVTIVPIYLGYEYIPDVECYIQELDKIIEKKYSFFNIIKRIFQINDFGSCYVNFGRSIPLSTLLFNKILNNCSVNRISELIKSKSCFVNNLGSFISDISFLIMVRINNAVSVNAINLCSNILISSQKYSINRYNFLMQLSCYLKLLRNVPYSLEMTISNFSPVQMLQYVLSMKRYNVLYNTLNGVFFLPNVNLKLMRYYSNNVQHLFILPSFIANIICMYPLGVQKYRLNRYIIFLYPLFKRELFIKYEFNELLCVISNFIFSLEKQKLLICNDDILYPVILRFNMLKLLSVSSQEKLRNYSLVLFVLKVYFKENLSFLEYIMKIFIKKLLCLFNYDSKFSWIDTTIFSGFLVVLKYEGYIIGNEIIIDKVNLALFVLKKLIDYNMWKNIKFIVYFLVVENFNNKIYLSKEIFF